jgi:hypothetical protein
MKSMKSILAIFIAASLFVLGGCEKLEYTFLEENENSPELSIRFFSPAAAGMKDVAIGDTLPVENGSRVNFLAVSNGPNIITWQWTFADGSTAYGASISHVFTGEFFTVEEVRLLAIDQDDQTYQRIISVQIFPSLDGAPAIKVISTTDLGGGLFRAVIAFNKVAMRFNGEFFYIGDITSPAWVPTLIAPADTNYYIINDTLALPTNPNDIAKFVAVRMILAPGDYQLGVGRIDDGQQRWGSFWGEFVDTLNPTLAKLRMDINGNIITNASTVIVNLPGESGDSGADAVVRFDQGTDSLTLYTNNLARFSSLEPFIVIQDSVGIWSSAISQSALPGFENWGQIKLAYADMPMDYQLILKFGPQMSDPMTFSSNMSQSGYYDSSFQTIKIGLATTSNK